MTEAFASRLEFVLADSLATPLSATKDGSHRFPSFSNVVAHGEHLEHFHSYQRTESPFLGDKSNDATLKLHTDQALFLVFVQGGWLS